MSSPLSPNTVLERVYLEIRCKLLDIAACLDRVDRAHDGVDAHADAHADDRAQSASAGESDPRLAQIARGIDILSSPGPDRAERIQMLFSDPYVPHWNRREGRATNGAAPHN